jgi:hypothetical protein
MEPLVSVLIPAEQVLPQLKAYITEVLGQGDV